jgi:hypothetical protein
LIPILDGTLFSVKFKFGIYFLQQPGFRQYVYMHTLHIHLFKVLLHIILASFYGTLNTPYVNILDLYAKVRIISRSVIDCNDKTL